MCVCVCVDTLPMTFVAVTAVKERFYVVDLLWIYLVKVVEIHTELCAFSMGESALSRKCVWMDRQVCLTDLERSWRVPTATIDDRRGRDRITILKDNKECIVLRHVTNWTGASHCAQNSEYCNGKVFSSCTTMQYLILTSVSGNSFGSWNLKLSNIQVQVQVILRPTVSWPVRLSVGPPFGQMTRLLSFFFM
jgi:hypothetical protein